MSIFIKFYLIQILTHINDTQIQNLIFLNKTFFLAKKIMGSRNTKTKSNNQNVFGDPSINFVDPVKALTGQPFVQPSDQKKPPVPISDENEQQAYNLINLIEIPSNRRPVYSGVIPNRLNPFLSRPVLSPLAQQILPVISNVNPFLSSLVSPPLAMPNATSNAQNILQSIVRKNLNIQQAMPLPLAMPFFDGFGLNSRFAQLQIGQPFIKPFVPPFNSNFIQPIIA